MEGMEKLEREINEIFKKYARVDFIGRPELRDQKLMGKITGLAPRTLTFIYMQIKKDICENIPKEEITEGRFDTFNNVCKTVFAGMKKEDEKSRRGGN